MRQMYYANPQQAQTPASKDALVTPVDPSQYLNTHFGTKYAPENAFIPNDQMGDNHPVSRGLKGAGLGAVLSLLGGPAAPFLLPITAGLGAAMGLHNNRVMDQQLRGYQQRQNEALAQNNALVNAQRQQYQELANSLSHTIPASLGFSTPNFTNDADVDVMDRRFNAFKDAITAMRTNVVHNRTGNKIIELQHHLPIPQAEVPLTPQVVRPPQVSPETNPVQPVIQRTPTDNTIKGSVGVLDTGLGTPTPEARDVGAPINLTMDQLQNSDMTYIDPTDLNAGLKVAGENYQLPSKVKANNAKAGLDEAQTAGVNITNQHLGRKLESEIRRNDAEAGQSNATAGERRMETREKPKLYRSEIHRNDAEALSKSPDYLKSINVSSKDKGLIQRSQSLSHPIRIPIWPKNVNPDNIIYGGSYGVDRTTGKKYTPIKWLTVGPKPKTYSGADSLKHKSQEATQEGE